MTVQPIVSANTPVSAALYLSAANQAVRNECGWHVAPVISEMLVLDGSGGRALLLPSKRVKSIDLVLNDGKDVTGQVKYSRRSGVATLATGWSCDVGAIELTLTHGYEIDEVPDVAALIVALTKRAASATNFVQQTIGPASVRVSTGRDGGVLSVPLLESEKDLLAPYRLNWGA